jgi:hypothetical protein
MIVEQDADTSITVKFQIQHQKEGANWSESAGGEVTANVGESQPEFQERALQKLQEFRKKFISRFRLVKVTEIINHEVVAADYLK